MRRLVGTTLALPFVLVAGSAPALLTAELFVSSPILGIATTNPFQQGAVGPLVQGFDQIVLVGTVARGGAPRTRRRMWTTGCAGSVRRST